MARPRKQITDTLTAAGDIPNSYETICLVLAVVVREESGCSGGLPIQQALIDATNDLVKQAKEKDGNAVIHISYMHRVSSSSGCVGSKGSIEVYAWGTAVRVTDAAKT